MICIARGGDIIHLLQQRNRGVIENICAQKDKNNEWIEQLYLKSYWNPKTMGCIAKRKKTKVPEGEEGDQTRKF